MAKKTNNFYKNLIFLEVYKMGSYFRMMDVVRT